MSTRRETDLKRLRAAGMRHAGMSVKAIALGVCEQRVYQMLREHARRLARNSDATEAGARTPPAGPKDRSVH